MSKLAGELARRDVQNEPWPRVEDLRDMSDEQLGLTLNEAVDKLFRLKIQSQTERLDAPSELRRNRRIVARIKTIQNQRTQESSSRDVS